MITVTFPIPKGQVKAELERVYAEIQTRQTEMQILHTMARAIRDTCKHEFKTLNGLGNCIHCGHYVGSGDD